uniref:Sulfate transporter 3.1 n=1 Tax=Aegilops tauschii TaxID=37682 RepID=M8BFU5_AEGTA
MGSSKDLAVGTVAVASLLIASMLGAEVSATENPALYLHLAFTATFFAGVIQASLGILRHVAGLHRGLPVARGDRGVHGRRGDGGVPAAAQGHAGAGALHHLHRPRLRHALRLLPNTPVAMGERGARLRLPLLPPRHPLLLKHLMLNLRVTKSRFASLASVAVLSKRQPRFFWVSAAAPLTSVILGSLLVYFTHAENHGVQIIGNLKKGLNPISVTNLQFTPPYMMLALKTGLITGVIALAEGIAVGRSFAMFKNYHIDGNKEMIAIGTMNILGSFTSCYLTTGPFSRVEMGLVVAVAISVLRVLLFVARPRTTVLGNVPDTNIYRRMDQYTTARTVPGVLVLRVDSPIYFANSGYLRERFTRWIDEDDERTSAKGETGVQYVVLDMGAVGSIDTSGTSMLDELKKTLDRRGIQIVLANPGSEIMKKLESSKVLELIGHEWIFPTVGEAVAECDFVLHSHKPGMVADGASHENMV